MNEVSGWFIGQVFLLSEEPTKKEDLVVKLSGSFTEVAGEVDYLYPTEQEAWVEANKHLVARRQQAMRNIAFLSKPYIVNGIHNVDDPQKLAKWVAEAKEELRIVEQALRLCPQ